MYLPWAYVSVYQRKITPSLFYDLIEDCQDVTC